MKIQYAFKIVTLGFILVLFSACSTELKETEDEKFVSYWQKVSEIKSLTFESQNYVMNEVAYIGKDENGLYLIENMFSEESRSLEVQHDEAGYFINAGFGQRLYLMLSEDSGTLNVSLNQYKRIDESEFEQIAHTVESNVNLCRSVQAEKSASIKEARSSGLGGSDLLQAIDKASKDAYNKAQDIPNCFI